MRPRRGFTRPRRIWGKQKWEGFEGLDDAGDAAAAGSADVKAEDEAFAKLQHALQDTRHSSSVMCRPQRREYFRGSAEGI